MPIAFAQETNSDENPVETEDVSSEKNTEEEGTETGDAQDSQEGGDSDSENTEKKSKKRSRKKNDGGSDENSNEKTTITIINALKSGNKKDEKDDSDILTFEGNVKISVEKGATKTIISADSISYNRKHEMLFAQGAVRLEQTEKNGSVQTVTSDTLLFNTSTLEGVFDNSRVIKADSNAINLPSGSKITVASDLFARDDSGTIAFKDGRLTFCNEEDNPHWTIRASRIWLLPGNEFAFLNALVYVGAVPVLYLPAFYYPKDELIFNPVFGYRNRAGYYFQTTTYLYGRKPLANDDAEDKDDDIMADYFSLIKPTKLMDQKREGLILHNLDTEYKGDTTDYLKIMIDWYSNLGLATGIDGVYHPKNSIPTIEGNFVFGFSNSVFQEESSQLYFPYAESGRKYKDRSNFMGRDIPFRFKGGLKLSGSKPFTYSLDVPVYSDPFFNYDFNDRKESMDWFSYLLNNPNKENSDKTELEKFEAAEITSFNWNSNLSYNANLPDVIKPYISTISIGSFNSSVLFSEKTAVFEENEKDKDKSTDGWYDVTPTRKFFYPSTITPLKTSLRIKGTIFSTSDSREKKSSKNSDKTLAMELNVPSFFTNEDSDENSKDEDSNENSKNEKSEKTEEEKKFDEEDFFPTLNFSKPAVSSITPYSYSLGYSFDPDFTSQISYASEPLKTAEDFNWDRKKSSYLQVQAPLSFNQKFSFHNDFFSSTNSVKFDPLYQSHPYISDNVEEGGYSEASMKSLKETDYKATYFNIANDNTLSFKPLVFYPNFKNTGISWNTSIKWLRTNFIGDAENPEWDFLTVDWTDEESITAHSLNGTFAVSELSDKFSQSLVLTAVLPPQVKKYYSTLNLKFPYISLSAETGVSQKSLDDTTWKKEQFKQSASVNLFNSELKLTESYNYDREEEHSDSFKVALSYKGLQAAYTMNYTTPYDFDEESGWTAKTEKEFLPYSLSIAYTSTSKNFKLWKNRIEISPGLSTSLVYDFVRPTNSYFIFSPSLTFRLNKYFYLKFSSTAKNEVLYRYFQKAAGHEGMLPGETNIFKDLINGFRFDDEELRKSSGFKLKSIELTMTHDLHDWDFNLQFKIEPRIITEDKTKYYDFSPYFSLSVVWRPMDSFKTKIEDKYGEFVLNGSDNTK